jgi:hypothetical protein
MQGLGVSSQVVQDCVHQFTDCFYHFSIQWIWSSGVFLNFFRQTYVKYHGMVLPNWPQYLKLGHVQDLEGTLVPAKNYPKFWDLVDFQNL